MPGLIGRESSSELSYTKKMPTSKTGGGVATPFLTVEKKKVVEHDLIYEKSVLKK